MADVTETPLPIPIAKNYKGSWGNRTMTLPQLVEAVRGPAPTLSGGDAARGKARYATCAGCHGAQAQGVQPLGSALSRLNDWYLLSSLEKYKAGIRPADPARDKGRGKGSSCGSVHYWLLAIP